MKVQMQYTVDLNEVPFKIEELVKSCEKQLRNLSLIVGSLDTTDHEQFLERLDVVRKRLFSVDNRLGDCSSLLEGYAQATKETGVVENPISLADIDELQKQVELTNQKVSNLDEAITHE